MKKIILILFTIIFTMNLFTACWDGNGILGKNDEVVKETITSKEISIPIEQIRTLNPIIAKDEGVYYLNKLIYEGLFTLDNTMAPVGVLAESYQYGKDDKSVTIKLKKGILWQDGTKFSAKDVKFSIDAYLSIPNASKSFYHSYVSVIQSAKVINDTMVYIKFNDEKNMAIENLTFPIIPSHKFKKIADVQKDTKDFIPIGTGPYKVESMEAGKQIILKGNPHYMGTIPDNTLIVKTMPGKQEAVNLLEIGEVNVSFLKETDRDTLINDKKVTVTSFPSNEMELLGFNFKHGALQDRKVRQAIAYAIDNESIIETCYYNSGVLNDSVYYPNYLGIKSRKDLYDYNLDQAKLLLEQSGHEGLSLKLIFNGDDHARNLAAQMIKTGLEKIGISVSLISLNWNDYNAAVASGRFDLYIGGYRIKDTYDVRPILHSAYNNPIKYSNPILDNFLDRMQSAVTIEDKKKIYGNIHRILGDEIPYYCLLYKTYGLATGNGVKGNIQPYFNNIYNGCDTWNFTYEKIENK